MARLWSSGFELNSLTAGVEITSVTTMEIVTNVVRSGTYSLSRNGTGSFQFVGYVFASSPGNGPYYARIYFNLETSAGARTRILAFRGAANTRGTIALETNDTLTLWVGNLATQIGSATGALSKGTWYCVELLIDNIKPVYAITSLYNALLVFTASISGNVIIIV